MTKGWNNNDFIDLSLRILDSYHFDSIEKLIGFVENKEGFPEKRDLSSYLDNRLKEHNVYFCLDAKDNDRVMIDDIAQATFFEKWIRSTFGFAAVELFYGLDVQPEFDHEWGQIFYPIMVKRLKEAVNQNQCKRGTYTESKG